VQQVLLLVLQQRAAGAVHDALRHAGRAGGVENVQRMVEGQLREGQRLPAAAEAVPRRGARGGRAEPLELRGRIDVRHHDDLRHAGELGEHRGHRFERVELLAAIEVPIGSEQHLRGDLPETIEHPVHAKVRRAGGPDRTDARAGEHRDGGLWQVGHEGGDAIPLSHARLEQPRRDARDLQAQLAVGEHPARAALVAEHQRGLLVIELEQVLREV
jgi:hypothetical protein